MTVCSVCGTDCGHPPCFVETRPIPKKDLERASRFVRERGWCSTTSLSPLDGGHDGTDTPAGTPAGKPVSSGESENVSWPDGRPLDVPTRRQADMIFSQNPEHAAYVNALYDRIKELQVEKHEYRQENEFMKNERKRLKAEIKRLRSCKGRTL